MPISLLLLFNALYAAACPIYWGDPLASNIFNPEAYIHVKYSPDTRQQIEYMMEAVRKIKEYDQNESLYNAKSKALPVLNAKKHDDLFCNEMRRVADLFRNRGFLKAG